MGKYYKQSRYRNKNECFALLGESLDNFASYGLMNLLTNWSIILEVWNVLGAKPKKHGQCWKKRKNHIYDVALTMFDIDKNDVSVLATRECTARKVLKEVFSLAEGVVYNVSTLPKSKGISLPFTADHTCEFEWNENAGNENAELYAIYEDMSVLCMLRVTQKGLPEDKVVLLAEELKYGNIRKIMQISNRDMGSGTTFLGYDSKFDGLYLPKHSGLEVLIKLSRFRKK